MTLLQAIERVVELARDSKMDKELFRKAKEEIKLLSDSYGITEQQAVLFCICMEKGPRCVDYDDIANYLDMRKISMMSEKNVKALFNRYREQVKRAKLTPILLFNEADAIIGKRKNGAENAVDKMENSLQNIILQEMEQLDGIMIATTNLQQNMDKAFERRFLYKIKFDKPTEEARRHIWHTMIPEIKENDAARLAELFDFSGGQIENIARKYSINNILHGDVDNPLEILTSYCNEERIQAQTERKIGF